MLPAARGSHVADEKPPRPISHELMRDPRGETCEREALVKWFRTRDTDRMNNAKLRPKRLTRNLALRRPISVWREEHPGRGLPRADCGL